jgi:hypothetical protein
MIMNARQFYELVKLMRKEQRMFFSTRLDYYKKRAIELERLVDAEIEHTENKLNPKPIQQTLGI